MLFRDDTCSLGSSSYSDQDDYELEAPNDETDIGQICKQMSVEFYPVYVPRDEHEETSQLTAEAVELEVQAATTLYNMGQKQALADACGADQSFLPISPPPVVPVPVNLVVMPVAVPMMLLAPHSPMPGPAAAAAPVIPLPAQYPSRGSACADLGKTTVMWRNIPNNYSRNDLLELLNLEGFSGSYDFFYSPTDFKSNALVGYAFINLVCEEEANRFYEHFQGFTRWTLRSSKRSVVTWSSPLQGLEGHIERYQNSPVMHPDVPDDLKPLLFRDGRRVPFPPPTKRLHAPHLKDCRFRA